jgi:hypothetical protein
VVTLQNALDASYAAVVEQAYTFSPHQS